MLRMPILSFTRKGEHSLMELCDVMLYFTGVYVCTRVAAERHLPSGGVCVRHPEVPVFKDAHGGCIIIPARVA